MKSWPGLQNRLMDPFARKMVYGSFIYGGMMLAMFAVLSVVYFHLRPACADQVMADMAAPGKKWSATIMERRCGENAAFYTHVNLRIATQPLKYGFFSGKAPEGEVFLIERDLHAAGLVTVWTGPDQLTIQCPKCAGVPADKREEKWGPVTIRYMTSDLPQPGAAVPHGYRK